MYLKQLKKDLLTKDILLSNFQKKLNLKMLLKLNLNLFYNYMTNRPSFTKFIASDLVIKKNSIYNLVNCSEFVENILINFRPKLNFRPTLNRQSSNILKSVTFTHRFLFYLVLFKLNNPNQEYFIARNIKQYELNFNNSILILLKDISSHNNETIHYSSKVDWTSNLFFRIKLKNFLVDKNNYIFKQLFFMNLNSILKI